MRMLRVIEFLSLDGVIQAPGAREEDTEGGFRHGGWQRPYVDAVLGATAAEGMAATDAYLFGRKTFEAMASYWPTVGDEDPYARHLNRAPKYVASRTRPRVEWQNAALIEGDVVEEVLKLKDQRGGNIAVLGSGELARTLIAHDLVDEYFLVICPIVLGSGKRLFGSADEPTKLSLVDSKPTGSGAVMLTYRPLSRSVN
jgi:dihydrofolate reductase